MNYTCEDCCIQCIERSRMYVCASFKLGKLSASEIKAQKQQSDKSSRSKANKAKNGAQCARKENVK